MPTNIKTKQQIKNEFRDYIGRMKVIKESFARSQEDIGAGVIIKDIDLLEHVYLMIQ